MTTVELDKTPEPVQRARALLRRVQASLFVPLACSALFGFAIAAAVTLSRGWPALPTSHDEASLVLAADTFARGRLTNQTPPFAEHFETFHELVRPSYASKYPPAQGLVLALGQVLTGAPIVGVWLSTGLLCAALTWMLLGWFPLRWALWGSILMMLMLAGGSGNSGYFVSTYWGGTVAATGAALVFGSVPRIQRAPGALNAAVFALGLGILALSRPFEGFLVAVPALGVMFSWLLRDRGRSLLWKLRRVVAPFGVVVVLVAGFMLAHNTRVTGNAFRTPYIEYESQYSNVPLFLLSAGNARSVEYGNETMRRFYAEQRDSSFAKTQSARALLRTELDRTIEIKRFLAPGLTLILVIVVLTSRQMLRALALPLSGVALVLAGALTVTWFFPHYIAPAIAPWAILITGGAQRLAEIEPPPGRTGLVLVWLIFAGTAFAAVTTSVRLQGEEERAPRRASWVVRRDSLARALRSDGGQRHLVLVSYGAQHDVDNEWVHNEADLDESAVLWARSLTPAQDARLIAHFSDRKVWRAEVDSGAVPLRFRAITNTPLGELLKP